MLIQSKYVGRFCGISLEIGLILLDSAFLLQLDKITGDTKHSAMTFRVNVTKQAKFLKSVFNQKISKHI